MSTCSMGKDLFGSQSENSPKRAAMAESDEPSEESLDGLHHPNEGVTGLVMQKYGVLSLNFQISPWCLSTVSGSTQVLQLSCSVLRLGVDRLDHIDHIV